MLLEINMDNTILIKVYKKIAVNRLFKIVDSDTWKKRKNDFIAQINCGKDMGNYIGTDYCSEEFGIEPIHNEDISETSEWDEIISMIDEKGEEV
jgi:hypothetical protein